MRAYSINSKWLEQHSQHNITCVLFWNQTLSLKIVFVWDVDYAALINRIAPMQQPLMSLCTCINKRANHVFYLHLMINWWIYYNSLHSIGIHFTALCFKPRISSMFCWQKRIRWQRLWPAEQKATKERSSPEIIQIGTEKKLSRVKTFFLHVGRRGFALF